MGLGERIDYFAKLNGLSLKELSKVAKVPYTTLYSLVKRDSHKTDMSTLSKIATALNISWDDLFPDGDRMNESQTLFDDPGADAKRKQDRCNELLRCLQQTRACAKLLGLEYQEEPGWVVAKFIGGRKNINVAGDSDFTMIQDVVNRIADYIR